MRHYFSESNLWRALTLGGVIALMSVPRILYARLSPAILIPQAFLGMTLVSGAATAWSRRAGLPGLFPRERALKGAWLGLALACALLPVSYFWLDPAFRAAIEATGNVRLMRLQYPPTAGECLALVLWAAGFELMFFGAAAVCFFARIVNRRWLAVVLAVMLRVAVLAHQLTQARIPEAVPLFVLDTVLTSAVACTLFARMGLPAASVFVAGLDARLFLYL